MRAYGVSVVGGLRRIEVMMLYLTQEDIEGLRLYAAWPKWDPEGSRLCGEENMLLWGRGIYMLCLHLCTFMGQGK